MPLGNGDAPNLPPNLPGSSPRSLKPPWPRYVRTITTYPGTYLCTVHHSGPWSLIYQAGLVIDTTAGTHCHIVVQVDGLAASSNSLRRQ